jgi:hypothetical protein
MVGAMRLRWWNRDGMTIALMLGGEKLHRSSSRAKRAFVVLFRWTVHYWALWLHS